MNRSFLCQGGLWLLLFLCWLPAARAQTEVDKISKIVITNATAQVASDDLVRAHIRIKVGDVWNRKRADDDLADLYGTGFFANIIIRDQPTPDGVIVTYILYGKMRLTSIAFEGNTRYSNSKLLKK